MWIGPVGAQHVATPLVAQTAAPCSFSSSLLSCWRKSSLLNQYHIKVLFVLRRSRFEKKKNNRNKRNKK